MIRGLGQSCRADFHSAPPLTALRLRFYCTSVQRRVHAAARRSWIIAFGSWTQDRSVMVENTEDCERDRARLDMVILSRVGRVGADPPQNVLSKEARHPPSILCAFDLEAAGSTSSARRNVFVHEACRSGRFTAEDYASAFEGAPPDELLVPRLLHDFLAGVDAKELAAAVALIMSEVDGVVESLHLESSKASQQLDEVLEILAGADWQIPVKAQFGRQ